MIIVRGVGLKDLSYKDIIKQKIAYGKTSISNKTVMIPSVFTTLEEWPETSNLLCWYCKWSFSGRPKPIVTSWEPVISTYGNFCSFECAKSHIIYYKDPKLKNEITTYIDLLNQISILFGNKNGYIIEADHFFNHFEFSGESTK